MKKKRELYLSASPLDAASLAKLFERITGKRVSASEIKATQAKFDGSSSGVTVAPKRK